MSQIFDISQIDQIPHHTAMSEITDILCHRTGNVNRSFFHPVVAYFLGLIPSSQHAMIDSPERGMIPVNIYSISLATSGYGKGHSVSIMEDVIRDFQEKFTIDTFPAMAEQSLWNLAVDIAAKKSGDESEEMRLLENDFKRQGTAPFLFDSGTGPALKQLRYKLLLGGSGAINFQMDEIGSNLITNSEVLNVMLELYDLGRIKTKLVKNTVDNERGLDIVGSTPANMLMFGTTSKLFDGGKIEDEFFSFLDTGYARRCLFGLGHPESLANKVSPEDVYNSLVSKNRSSALSRWRQNLAKFAHERYANLKIQIDKPVGVELVAYRLHCEYMANQLPEHEVIRKAELSHRYFKALKLAGVYAFIDDTTKITKTHLYQAIKLVEESGESFNQFIRRERNFVRLAKYIAESPDVLTHADLVEDLPFYPTSTTQRKELMDLAMAWGVGNHVVIKKDVISNVDFFSGSTLQETDFNKLKFSYSDHFAQGYSSEERPLDELPKLLGAPDLHWCNHSFNKEHRSDENAIEGFNMVVIDVDGDIPLKYCQEIMSEYTYITSTTKRHTEEENRFRLIMPTNYILELNKEDYKLFMDSFLLWLPFKSDNAANQRSKKWMTLEGSEIHVNKGTKVLDVLPFIPKTRKNSDYVNSVADLGRLDNLERWFISNMEEGDRNNKLLNYSMMLKDAGADFETVSKKVLDLNNRISLPLSEEEVQNTILKSVGAKY